MGQTGGVNRVVLLVMALLLAGCASGTNAQGPTPAPCDPGPPGTRQVTVGDRSFLLHVPRDFVNPSPVVFAFHGRGSNAQQQLLLTSFDQVAEQGRFLLVAPEAVGGRWDFRPNGKDAEYLQAVGDAVPCADPARVYASGMSMGSAMTFALACASDRKFAAFGGVALTLYRPRCDQAPPAPIIYFHGTKDPIVPFEGGKPQGEPVTLPAVPDAMQRWAEHNDCTAQATQQIGKDVRFEQWSDCAADADVDYYRVRGGGHTWPGTTPLIADAIEASLGKTTQSVNASQLMWEFFEGYTLPGAG